MIRRILANCVKSKKEGGMPESPFIGHLPEERVKICEKHLAAQEWITLNNTLSIKKIEKKVQLKV